MECDKHDKMVVMHAFSYGNCIKCNTKITTPHIPCNKVCDKCSNELKLCVICGDKVEK